MKNIRLLLLIIMLPTIAFSQDFSVQSIQKINNSEGGLTGSPLGNGDQFGIELSVIGDVDHDGVDDVAIGALKDDDGATDAGAIYILMLNTDGTVKAQQKISSTTGGGPSLDAGDGFGVAIAELGDLNGDGNVDVAVGAYSDDDGGSSSGAVYILFLDNDGTVLEYQKIGATSGGGPTELNDQFGVRVANIGDINADGLPDLAISANKDDDGGTDHGALYICFMDYNGTVKSYQKISELAGGFTGTLPTSSNFSTALALIGDIDGDGVNDLAVGDFLDDDGGADRGAVWILRLNTDGTVKANQKISDTTGNFTGTLDNTDWFGRSLVGLTDLDGDGISELGVGAEKDDDGGSNEGALWILYLDSTGNVKSHQKISTTDAQLSSQVSSNDGFTKSLSFFGDRSNDGKIDLLIGAHTAVDGSTSSGEIYVVHFEGIATYPIKQYHATEQYITVVEKHSAASGEPLASELDTSDYYGYAICSIGDLDGDGVEDMAVGAYQDDDGGSTRGAVYVQFLNTDGSIKSYQKISDTAGSFTGTLVDDDNFGVSITSLGDLDGDGNTDIAVGASKDNDGGTDRGAVWILFLDNDGTVKSYQKISDTAGSFTGTLDNNDFFGNAVTSPGDIDGDGIADLVVGVRDDDDGGANRGAVWVLFLDTNGTVKSHQKISDTNGNLTDSLDDGDRFGISVASIGDMDDDGIPDIVVGAYGDDDGGTDKGAVYVLFMTDSGYVKSEQKISMLSGEFDGFIEDSDFFGVSVSGGNDLNQDGVNDILVGAHQNDNGGNNRGMVWMLLMNADGTVNYHKTFSSVSAYLTGLIDDIDFSGIASSIVHYNSQNNTAKIAIGAYRDDDGAPDAGAVYLLTLDMMSAFNPAPSAGSTHRSSSDLAYNWSYGESYDENGKIIGKSKQYVDELGRNTQSLTWNMDKNRVLTAQTIYDKYGRPVVNTLPAPTGINMIYKTNFATDLDGNVYGYSDFDGNHTLNDPDSIGNDIPNSLGDYYSDNGEDEYLATSYFPYSRMEYMADPTGRMKRSAAPGENFKMGSGHESRVFYMFTGGELDKVYGEDSSFYVQTSSSNRLESVALGNNEIVADKTISVDAEGNIAIRFKSDGLTIASCVSGKTIADTVETQAAASTMLYAGTQSVDIHLPEAESTTLKLTRPTWPGGDYIFELTDTDVVYTIMDLENNSVLDSGTNYTINLSTKYVTFLGTNKHRFLRITFAYSQGILDYWEANSKTPPDVKVEYTLDYSHFSVNYYDLMGRLRKNVSPKGFNEDGNHTEFSRYDYDPFGQLIEKETPDEGLMEYLYSNEGVVRFSQNAQQAVDDKFSYVMYDDYNRPIESGEYDETGAVFEFAGYYDTTSTGTDVKDSINVVGFDFDDDYCSNQNYIAYDILASADEIPSAYTYKSQYTQHNLKGRASKTWDDYNQTWYSFDYAGRPEFVVQQLLDADFDADTTADETVKTIDYTYAPLTSVLLTEAYQKNHSNEKLTHEFTYNDNQQLVGVLAKDTGDNTIGEAAFEYYINGQLKRKEIGGELQGIDYVYTLLGQLKSINHPSLYDGYDPGQDGKTGSDNATFEPDVFGMALDYYQDDYTRTGSNIVSSVETDSTGYNNGLIKAARWRIKDQNEIIESPSNVTLYTEASTDKELMYNYTYDEFYRFETATFGVFDNDASSSAFTSQNDFKVYGTSSNAGIDYDIIGNITALNRNGYDGTPGLLMDSLSYTYATGKSRLDTITDNSSSTYTTDFETSGGAAFTYNSLGQMTASVADSVDTVSYYPTGQVKKVTFGNGNYAEYFYNERNIKIKSKFTDVGATSTKYNWYITDAGGALKSVHERTDGGSVSLTNQAIYGGGRLGMYDVTTGILNYEITDHLGNVRLTIRDSSTVGDNSVEVLSWADYYPFGEVLPGRNSNPTGMFGYQGQERVSNSTNEVAGSRWYNFNLRMYNPSLGRFNTIDPYSQFNSPYLAMANNPISFVDPDGGRALLTESQRNNLIRNFELRKMRGEYYGRPLELMRHWAALTGNEQMNLGGRMVSADDLYAMAMSFFGVGTSYYHSSLGAMRGGGYSSHSGGGFSMYSGGDGINGFDAIAGIFGLETMTQTAGYGMTPEPGGGGGYSSLEYFASGEMQWAKTQQWANALDMERMKLWAKNDALIGKITGNREVLKNIIKIASAINAIIQQNNTWITVNPLIENRDFGDFQINYFNVSKKSEFRFDFDGDADRASIVDYDTKKLLLYVEPDLQKNKISEENKNQFINSKTNEIIPTTGVYFEENGHFTMNDIIEKTGITPSRIAIIITNHPIDYSDSHDQFSNWRYKYRNDKSTSEFHIPIMKFR